MGSLVTNSHITITVQPPQHEAFNFHKNCSPSQSQSLVYPSFLSKTEQAIQYARRSSYSARQYEISHQQGQIQTTLIFKRVDPKADPIWKNMAPNQTTTLRQGNLIKLADTQFEVKKICRSYSDLEEWEENQRTVSDVDPRESINLNLINSRRLQQSHFLKYSRNFPERNSNLLQKSGCLVEKSMNLPEKIMNLPEKSINKKQSLSSFGMDFQGEFCRYCYGKDSSFNNPLLNICKCAGSVKFSHYYCLKSWIASRSTTRAADCYEYFEYDLSCEVCKEKIEKTVLYRGKKFVIYSDTLIHPPFVVLAYTNEPSNNTNIAKVREYIINFDYSQTIRIGKSTHADLKLNERLISNDHCQLEFSNNQLLLRNRNPAYGTFLKIEDEWKFSSAESRLELMICNHLVQIRDQTSSCLWNKPLKLKITHNQ